MGVCVPPAGIDCTPFLCGGGTGGTACRTDCQQANIDCLPSAFCDANACCLLSDHGIVNVDGVAGDDGVGCCGVGQNRPCQTITRAMGLIDTARAVNVTINATVDGGGGDWSPPGEVYPVALGWGVELDAPGVYFLDPGGNNFQTIYVCLYSTNDTVGYASIAGEAAAPVGVGMNSTNTVQSTDLAAVTVAPGNTLYIANASVNGNYGDILNAAKLDAMAIQVTSGTLVLGKNETGTVVGTVHIGNALANFNTDGFYGIYCSGSSDAPASVTDIAADGQSSVIIQGQAVGLTASDYCNVNLSYNPVIGSAIASPACADLNYVTGIAAIGAATVTLNNVAIQCQTSNGVATLGDDTGSPSVSINNAVITANDTGVLALGGRVTVTNSLVIHNRIGVQQDTDGISNGLIDLSGGGNTVICSHGAGSSGVDVYNNNTSSLNASYVAWDTAGPDYFACDTSLTTCTCNLSACSTTPGSDDMDAVEDSTNLGGIVTTGNTMSPLALDGGCG